MSKPEPLQFGQFYHIYNRGNDSEILFSTYTKAFNRAFGRTGSLFEKPFRRRLVDNDRYFVALIAYIHRNPQNHGFVTDFRTWPHSSYQAVASGKPTRVQRDAVVLDVEEPAQPRLSREVLPVGQKAEISQP